jgi:phage replication initiation protein
VKSTQRVKVDWLTFTSAVPYPVLISAFLQCAWPESLVQHNEHGVKGYPESGTIFLNGQQIGLVGHGSKHGRTMISLSGTAFKGFTGYWMLYRSLKLVDARLTRLDLALDFYNGEITYEQVKDAHAVGEFQLPKASKASTVGEICSSRDGVNYGRTFMVGSRKSSKMLRAYEKGLEIFAKMPDNYKELNTDPTALIWGSPEGAPDGTIAENWLRVECEFKNADVDLELGMILRRDKYFAGAYPFCARVLGLAGVRPKALKDEAQIELHKMILAARNSYGNLFFTLRELGFTSEDILSFICGFKHNEKLAKAGIISKVKNNAEWLASVRAAATTDQPLPF